jgi:hypothetical protein
MTESYHDATREQLMQNLEQLQRLQAEGVNVGSLPEEVWQEIVECIEANDDECLERVRKELREEIDKKEVIIGC